MPPDNRIAMSVMKRANMKMPAMKRKKALKITPIAWPMPLPSLLAVGEASLLTCFPHSSTSPPQAFAFSPKSWPNFSALPFTSFSSSCTEFLMLSRSTFSPRISSFSEAVFACGITIQRMI